MYLCKQFQQSRVWRILLKETTLWKEIFFFLAIVSPLDMTKNKRSPTLGETEQSPKRYKSDTLSVRLDDPFADDSSKENDTVDAHVALARSRVLERLSEKSIPRRLHGLDSQRDKLKSLLQQTIKMGESNSCLIIGNRGTGKTALVRNVLQDLEKEYNNDAESGFYVVRLNGQTETSDRLALAEIAKQLFAKQQQVEQSLKGRTFVSCWGSVSRAPRNSTSERC